MIAGDLPDIPEYMDIGTLKVHAPTAVVIVCGGPTEIDFNRPITSLRDAFMRISGKANLSKFDIRLAEDIIKLPRIGYNNLLRLESDISQISELVMLFTESAGSLAELGVFIMDDEVSPKLMVVVDKYNYEKNSFIRLGAFEHLESNFGEESVCVIDLRDHNVDRIEAVVGLNIDTFEKFIAEKILKRIEKQSEPRTFEKTRNGHLIKLMTGLIQNYGALTYDEIEVLLFCIDIKESQVKLRGLLGCAELFDWIKIEKNGTRTFYAARGGRIALNFDQVVGSERVNKRQWRSDVREYWKDNDPDRFKSISAAAGVK